MNICLISHEYPPETGLGGIGTYTYHLAHGLVDLGHEVHVLSMSPGGHNQDSEDNGVHVHRIPRSEHIPDKGRLRDFYRRMEYSLAVERGLQRLCGDIEFDIIEGPNLEAEAFAYSFNEGPPLVTRIHTHSSKIQETWGLQEDSNALLANWMEKTLIERSDLVLSSTQTHADTVAREQDLSYQRLAIVPLGIPLPEFHPNTQDTRDTPQVLFVGRLEPRKGLHTLMQAVPLVLKRFPNAEFQIVGQETFLGAGEVSSEGDAQSSYKTQLLGLLPESSRERVHFLGRVSQEDLEDLYQNCAFLCVPSWYESCGLIFMEAMARSKAVIGCLAGGMPEIIRHGETGLIVPPKNPALLAEAINQLLSNQILCEEFGRKGRALAEDYYNRERFAQDTIKAYLQVLA
ncbi:MAG: glycosyltransferase family 4 protein [Candidatus Omnitrophica bacterium]|nr:glycosyltransferase family 4 protein [Candidatus Omnitrophota bacterium]